MLPPCWMLTIKKRALLYLSVLTATLLTACGPAGPRALMKGERLMPLGKRSKPFPNFRSRPPAGPGFTGKSGPSLELAGTGAPNKPTSPKRHWMPTYRPKNWIEILPLRITTWAICNLISATTQQPLMPGTPIWVKLPGCRRQRSRGAAANWHRVCERQAAFFTGAERTACWTRLGGI